MGHQEPREESTVDLQELQLQPGDRAAFTNQSFDPWAQGLEKFGKWKDLKKIGYDLKEQKELTAVHLCPLSLQLREMCS